MTAGEQPAFDMQRDRLVITASALGTVFEWYDFFLYGILATLIGRLFFPIDNPTAATLASLATFGAGFGVRPLGAMLFGHYGDRIGRKYTFLVTITVMGLATAAIGLLPTYASAGLWAPALLVTLRLVQGLALGGEYGGAAIYVAEHAPSNRRGEYTSWIQVAVVVGFLLCLAVVLISRLIFTPEQFESWGWRVPFLISIILLGISVYIRMKLTESPVFQAMKAAGKVSKNPILESFSSRENIGRVLLALFGVTAGMTVIYYTAQFGTLYFLTGNAKIDERQALMYLGIGSLLAAPFYILFGMLSDRIGRRKVLLCGYVLALLLMVPLFQMVGAGANPQLARAAQENPVVVESPDCNYSVFARTQAQPCAKAMGWLARNGIAYTHEKAPSLVLYVGAHRIVGFDEAAYAAALTAAGYPEKADPDGTRPLLIIAAIFMMVVLSAMTYSQVAAILVELFPPQVRYTSLSVPYHIGSGYFGGFLPFIQQLLIVKTGNPLAGLWYTLGVIAIGLIVSLLFLPETRGRDIGV